MIVLYWTTSLPGPRKGVISHECFALDVIPVLSVGLTDYYFHRTGVSTSSHSSMDGGVREKASSSEGGAQCCIPPQDRMNKRAHARHPHL